MARRPYNPDRSGSFKPKESTHSRVGFSAEMRPVYGTIVDDILTEDVRNALVPAYYKTGYGITTSNSEAGVISDKSGDALTAALGILDDTVAAWRWDGFSLKLPDVLETSVSVISDFVNTIVGFLEAVKSILDVIAAISLGLSDALKVLVDNLKAVIDDVLGLFTGETGIYGISIPLSSPGGAKASEKIAFLKSATSTIKLATSKTLVDLGITPSSIPGRATLSMLPPGASLPQTIGGTEGFINTLESSLSDSGDLNRPTFGPNAWVGGYVIMYGGTDLVVLKNLIDRIGELFGKLKIEQSKALPPRPTGLSLEVLSPRTTSANLGSPRVAVRWDRPKIRFSLSSFYPNWDPIEDIIYKVVDPYALSVSQRYDRVLTYDSFYRGIDDYSLLGCEVAKYDTNGFPRSHIDESFTPEDLGKTYTYRIGRRYRRATADKTYAPGSVLVLSAPASALLPTEPGRSRSIAPDWTSATIGEFLPQSFVDLLNTLRETIFNILDILSDIPNVLLDMVQNIIDEIQKWIDLSRRLQAILNLIKKVLDIGAGAWAMGFFGLGGNEFLINTLRSSIDNAPSGTAKASSPPVTPSQNLSDFVENTEARFEGATFSDWVSTSVVPDFGPNDSVGGLVLLAGDESMQAALQTFRILKTLFGGGEKVEKSTGARSYEVDQLLGVSAVPDYTAKINAVLGPAPTYNKQTLFSESLLGTDDPDTAADGC